VGVAVLGVVAVAVATGVAVVVAVTDDEVAFPVGVELGVAPGLAASESALTEALTGSDGEFVFTNVSIGAWIVTGAEAVNCCVVPPDVDAKVSVLTLVTVCEPEPALGTLLSLLAATFTG
jgi:hypothetical protein